MTRFVYVCPRDETRADVEREVSEALSPWPCPACGHVMHRSFEPPVLVRPRALIAKESA